MTAPAIELVRAEAQHCRFLYDLYAQSAVMAAHGLKRPVPAADWRRLIEGVWDGWKDLWVVYRGGFQIGHAGLQNRDDLDRRAEVVVTIDPSCRERGVGREVLTRIIEICTEQGIDTLISRVMFGNEASLALFQGAGFREVGRIPRYYRTSEGVFSQIILARYADEAALEITPTAIAAPRKPRPVKPAVRRGVKRVKAKAVRRKSR